MIVDQFINFVSRLVKGATGHNTLNATVVEVFFHRSPGWPSGDTRGIEGLEYQIMTGGAVAHSGKTGKDGKIEVTVSGGQAELQLMSGGKAVASYQVNVRSDPYEAGNTIKGVQRRLRGLGYQVGHDGAAQNGVTNSMNEATDRAILEFQVDQNLAIDGKVGPHTQSRLNNAVGGTAL